jgi:DNA-binding Lrp family transcriptional regulator
MAEIDKIDRRILSILQTDGRISAVDLAERVGLSPTTTGERLRRLLKEGYITGFGARLNPHLLGFGLLGSLRSCWTRPRPMSSTGLLRRYPRRRKCLSAIWSPGASTILSRPAWPIWEPTGASLARCCLPCPVSVKPEHMRLWRKSRMMVLCPCETRF